MEKKINVAELLKDCPEGMELDCTMFDNVHFERVIENVGYPIKIKVGKTDVLNLTKYGCWNKYSNAKCVIFPKGKTTWEDFFPPCKFKDGDIVFYNNTLSIFRAWKDETFFWTYAKIYTDIIPKLCDTKGYTDSILKICNTKGICGQDIREQSRLATEEEKQKLFDAIKASGYKWNAETKTLEKLAKFKVGDRVKSNFNKKQYKITELTDTYYTIVEVNSKFLYKEEICEDANWELVPDKFDISTLKPFESRVLCRDNNKEEWTPAFWGYYSNANRDYKYKTIGCMYRYCIPYEGNEHLLGSINDCDEYYKTWEE